MPLSHDVFWGIRYYLGASKMTTNFLTMKVVNLPKFCCRGLWQENQRFSTIPFKFPPPRPLQNANFINIVVSESLTIADPQKRPITLKGLCKGGRITFPAGAFELSPFVKTPRDWISHLFGNDMGVQNVAKGRFHMYGARIRNILPPP